MSPVGKYRITALLAGGALLTLIGCSSPNSQAPFNPDTGQHPANWLSVHMTAASSNINACTPCHGADLNGGISGVSCNACHLGGLTSAHVGCSACHSDLYAPMSSAAGAAYHHLMKTDTPAYAGGECLQCHVDHNISTFNTGNTIGRSANLRTNFSETVPEPPTAAGYTNSDFLSADIDGGLCLSCHKAALTKEYPQPDATTATPVIPFPGSTKADYEASAHHYVAVSTFKTDGSPFNADCSKCHSDTLNPKSSVSAQGSTKGFGLHVSTLRRILAALGIVSPADPLGENFCFQCHSGTGPGYDYYGVQPMSAASRNIQAVFSGTYGHISADGYSSLHKPSTADETLSYISSHKHVVCEDCHNPHAAQPGTHQVGSAALANVLRGVSGADPDYPANTNWPAAGAAPVSTFTYTKVDPSLSEYRICFKCHSYANTNVLTWGGSGAAAWMDAGLEFDPNNRSYHPVVQALPATNPNTTYGSSQLSASELAGGWTPGQVMTCSDCHATDSAASTGPHGSAVKWMLAGANKAWPYQGAANNGGSTGAFWTLANNSTNSGTADGLFCLNCHNLNSSATPHFAEDAHTRVPCVSCHIRVPHGGKVSRLIATATPGLPARYSPDGTTGSGVHILQFRKATSGGYSEGNCATNCGEHGSTIPNPEFW